MLSTFMKITTVNSGAPDIFQFCILIVWSANGDAPFQGKFRLNDDTYRWNCGRHPTDK